MRAFYSLFRFEVRYQVFGPTFIVSFGFFFLLTFAATVSDQVRIGGPSSVNINAPSAIALTLAILGLFGLFIPTAMLANGVIRDKEFRTSELFYSTPVGSSTFILGRFLGGYTATLLAFSSVPLAMYLGCYMPWLNPEQLGPMNAYHFIYVFLTISAVNLLISGLVFFTVANLTRSIFATYTALIVFLVIYFVGLAWAREPEYRRIAALLDPLAINTLREMMQYWTPAQRNTELIALNGVFLTNRMIWLSSAAALLGLNLAIFRFRSPALRWRRKVAEDEHIIEEVERVVIPKMAPEDNAGWTQLWTRIRFEAKSVVRSVAFWILLVLGVLNTVGGLTQFESIYGTPSYPLTRIMLDVVVGAFSIIPVIVSVYYASELVWRERVAGIGEVIDATPTPNWVFVVSKFVALSIVVAALFLTAIVTAMVVQLFKGFDAFEFEQYALRLFADMILPIGLIAVLCLFLQVVFNNRWFGMLAVILYVVVADVASSFGYDHHLLIYASWPQAIFSDMNGYGHFLPIKGWFMVYWGLWAAAFGVLSYVLWNRGSLRPLWQRMQNIPRANGATKALLAVTFAGVAVTGGWIFYNTNVVNTYTNQPRQEVLAFDFEDRYFEKYLTFPQPKIIGIEVQVDIYPEERRSKFEGTYRLVNRTKAPVETVLVDYDYRVNIESQTLDGGKIEEADKKHNVYRFSFSPPWPPNEERILSFSTERPNPGFRNDQNVSKVVANGTFLNNRDGMPVVGFNWTKLMQPRNVRRRYDREPLPRAPKLEDERYWNVNALRADSDWVTFTATLSTSKEQVAIAPGYLARQWEEGDRRFFRYEMDRPIQNFFSFQSANYEVKEEDFNGIKLQVFYHKGHEFNVDRIMASMRDSLAYFGEVFSPFQYRQMRVLEFPAYATFAQSFANTVPFSEAIGYVLDLRDAKSFDVAYYVTAHEVAHQWWGHQVVPAPNQGATMVIETFAQYGALIAVEKKYGQHQMRRFLQYELDRYLRGRSSEPEGERPLYKVENQPYIHYRKGAVAMYELRDRLGEDLVNRSLARFIKEAAGKVEPYPRTVDYLRILREEAGPEHEQLITDLFERIVLYDLRVVDTKVTARADGRYDVALTVKAAKFEADEEGTEKEIPLDMEIDVGAFSEPIDDVYEGDDHVLFFEKRRVKTGESTIEFTVDKPPVEVGLDPYNKMIDRVSADNLKRVEPPTETDGDA